MYLAENLKFLREQRGKTQQELAKLFGVEQKTFCTSGGSAFSDAVDEIKNMEPDATILDGLHIGSSSVTDAESRVSEWVQGLGLSK